MDSNADKMSLPPGQQIVATGKWPIVGERQPRPLSGDWTVTCCGEVERVRTWSVEELRSMPQETHHIDIHCVTRWSKPQVEFRGVPLSRMLEACAVRIKARFVSFVAASERDHSTSVPLDYVLQAKPLMAFEADGQLLSTEHGGPVRVVVPGRYFYKSLKWLRQIVLLEEDQLGYWEREAGYHNHADPWREERFISSDLDLRTARELIAKRDFSGRDLRGIIAAGLDLRCLRAEGAKLRDAHFEGANLEGSCFDGANLSGAHLQRANLKGSTFRPSTSGVLADLEGADFRGADLRGVRFFRASLFGATFGDVGGNPGLSPALVDSSTECDQTSLDSLNATPDQLEFLRLVTVRGPGH